MRSLKEVLEHKWLAMMLRDATDPNTVIELVTEMEKLDYDVPCLAFSSKGKLQNKFIMATTYSDEWTVLKDKRGNEIGAVRSWYVCCSGGASNQCNTLILSKDWGRMKQDPLATGQRWYCKVCFARYAHKFGQVVEVSYKDQVFYFWALPLILWWRTSGPCPTRQPWSSTAPLISMKRRSWPSQ